MENENKRYCPICSKGMLDSHEGSKIIYCSSCNAIFKEGIEHFNFTTVLRKASRADVFVYGNEEEKKQWPFKQSTVGEVTV